MIWLERGSLLSLIAMAVCLLGGCPPSVEEGRPEITIDSAPRLGDTGTITGSMAHVQPRDHAVAVYLYNESQGGWWNVPDFIEPLTDVADSRAWSVEMGAGARVKDADIVAAFLVPDGTEVPLLAGVAELPGTLSKMALANYYLERGDGGNARLILFAGHQWRVKDASSAVEPGPAPFSDAPGQLWVDDEDRLHMTLMQRDGVWTGSALTLREPLGMGLYLWRVTSALDDFDPNVVFSLSLYDNPSVGAGLDIEFGRWGDPTAQNAQYVVQPGDVKEKRLIFDMSSDASTLHGIDWQRSFVNFRSTAGEVFTLPDPADLIAEFRYNEEGIPQGSETPAQIALWLFNGQPPSDGQPVEVVIEAFTFVP